MGILLKFADVEKMRKLCIRNLMAFSGWLITASGVYPEKFSIILLEATVIK